jgi:hypothetical protein
MRRSDPKPGMKQRVIAVRDRQHLIFRVARCFGVAAGGEVGDLRD